MPADVLQPLLTIDEGDYYDIDEVDDVSKEISDEVGRYGYAFLDVRPKVDRRREEKLVDIIFQVGEGPRVYVDRIDVVGNVRTLDGVIRREMQLAEGDDLRDLIPAVAFLDVSDHLVPSVLAEIDVEIRHGHAFRVQETLEQ